MKRNPVLYSAAMPVFMLLFTPRAWFYLLPINLCISIAALYFSLKAMEHADQIRPYIKKYTLPLFLVSFIGDLAGAGILTLLQSTANDSAGTWASTLQYLRENPFFSTNALIVIFLCIVVAALIKYLLCLWLVFRKADFEPIEKRSLCIYLAIFTAPYTFVLPGLWLGFLA